MTPAPSRRSTAASFPTFAARLADIDLEIAELERAEPTEVILQHVAELQALRDRLGSVFGELEAQRYREPEAPVGRLVGADRCDP